MMFYYIHKFVKEAKEAAEKIHKERISMQTNRLKNLRDQIKNLKKEIKSERKADRVKVGQRIKSIRIQKDMSQSDLSDLTGVSRTMIVHTEKGHNAISIDTLLNICHVLEVTPNEILGFN